MFTIIAVLASIASVCAFVPAVRTTRASSSLKMSNFANAEGAQPPLGFWDPLGFLNDATEEDFFKLRYAELKHGRVAMLGVTGWLTAEFNRFPGYLGDVKFTDIPNGHAGILAVPAFGLIQIFLSCGWWELKGFKQVPGSTPGDFGIPYLGRFQTEEEKRDIRLKELNNGRAAQMGLLALIVHEQIGNHPYVINDLLGIDYKFN